MDDCRIFDRIDIDALAAGSTDRMIPEARDPALYARHAAALDAVEARARAALGTPIPALPWSSFRLYRDSGNRYIYESPYFERRKRYSDLLVCILAGRDADGALLAAFQDLIWAICDEYTWALPAHLWDGENVRPEPIALDLFASETGFYLAETLHLLGDRLDPRIVARVRGRLRERILDSFMAPYATMMWEDGHNNWSAVCGGSVGAVFLYEERDPARRQAAIARILGILKRYIASFPADGTCEEGTGYWAYGFGYYVLFADLLRSFTSGRIDLFDDPKIHAIARYPQRAQLSANRTVSFSDGDRFYSPLKFALERLNACFPDVALPGGPISGNPNQKPGNLVRDFAWCDPACPAQPPPDANEFFAGQEWLVVRKAPFAFAALFGNNGVSHNHNDVGAFLLLDGDCEGPMDIGRGEYTRQYFGPERYGLLCCGSHGHSVPIVGGKFQKHGREYRAAKVSFAEKPDGTVAFSGDIAPAYGNKRLKSLRRAFRVNPVSAEATVADTFVFDGAPLSIVERFIGFEKPEIVAPGKVRFGAFDVAFDPSLAAKVGAHSGNSYGSPDNRVAKKLEVFTLDIKLPTGAKGFKIKFTARRA